TTSVMFGFANGMSGNLLSSLVTAVTYRLAVFGTKGCAELLTPEFDFRFSPVPGAPPTGRQVAAEPETIQNRGSNTLLAELEAFAAAIRGEAPYPITPEEILHGVAAFGNHPLGRRAPPGQGRARVNPLARDRAGTLRRGRSKRF